MLLLFLNFLFSFLQSFVDSPFGFFRSRENHTPSTCSDITSVLLIQSSRTDGFVIIIITSESGTPLRTQLYRVLSAGINNGIVQLELGGYTGPIGKLENRTHPPPCFPGPIDMEKSWGDILCEIFSSEFTILRVEEEAHACE